ncbi:voltage-gated potassium channel [Roseovarius azorensis]|uniref:Voltage-gated potassium channel n=1 Tax=Roseovarius azorensis TaxID=1287727 RepID=A0A1H7HPB4_9RHOB|nr:potassium channel family protein [Roseovarius azorensis]SEK52223.1 voltage-gated potassium channel [Roseovarius azorensis]
MKDAIRLLYEGRSRRATRFRYGLLIFDAFSIVFFLSTALLPLTPWLLAADTVIGLVIFADFTARLWISESRLRHIRQIYVLVDVIVLASLVAAPFLGQGLAALRLLRALRLIHSYYLLRDLRRDSILFRRHEDTIVAAVNLTVFIFAMTALVLLTRGGQEPGLETYVDALYFTVSTLTTTGFGDIAMTTGLGRLLAVGIMVVGVGLFLRLARAIFLPARVRHKCPDCGLLKHDPDAIHCKHCGRELNIETEGAG